MSADEVWTSVDEAAADFVSISEFGHGSGLEINTSNWLKNDSNGWPKDAKAEQGCMDEILNTEQPKLMTAEQMDANQKDIINTLLKANVPMETEFNGSMAAASNASLKPASNGSLFKKVVTSEESQQTQKVPIAKKKT